MASWLNDKLTKGPGTKETTRTNRWYKNKQLTRFVVQFVHPQERLQLERIGGRTRGVAGSGELVQDDDSLALVLRHFEISFHFFKNFRSTRCSRGDEQSRFETVGRQGRPFCSFPCRSHSVRTSTSLLSYTFGSTWSRSYKTFYGRNLRIFMIS